MIMKITSYLLLLLYTFIYTTNNYPSIVQIIGNTILIFGVLGLILYHFDYDIKSKKKVWFTLLLSIFCAFVTFGQLAYSSKKDTMTIHNISDSVVTLDAIYLDGAKQKIHHSYQSSYDRFHSASKKTAYQQYNKLDETYKATLLPNEKYQFQTKKSKRIKIELQRNVMAYNLLINDQKICVKPTKKVLTAKANMIYNSDFSFEYNNIDSKVSIFQTIFILFISSIVYFNIWIRILGHERGILLLLPVLLIEINPFINIDFITKLIGLFIYTWFILKFNQKIIFEQRKQKIIVMLASIYISFSFVGNHLLNDHVNAKFIAIFGLFCIWIYLLFPFILNFLDKIKKNLKKQEKKECRSHQVLVYCIIVLIGLIYQLAFDPYIVPPDGYMQIKDIQNNVFTNWHPYVHTLWMKVFIMLFGNLKYFIYFRIFAFAFIVTKILFYFYQKNLSLFKIYMIAILLSALPVTGVLLVTIYKDVDFTICFVFLTFLIYLLTMDFEYFHKNKFHYFFLMISLLGVGLFRHNGIIVMMMTSIFLLILSKRKKILLTITVLVAVLTMLLFHYPIYQKLKVQDAPSNFNVATILHGFNRLIYQENPKLDKEASKYLNKMMPLEDWKYSYDPYNIDLLLHYQEVDIRNMEINKKRLIQLYLKQGMKTPIELLKDRLYGIDEVWNVSQQDEVLTYKYQIVFDEFETDYGQMLNVYIKDNWLNQMIKKMLLTISKNEILNIFFFRGGIYIDILIILLVYTIMKKNKKLFLCLLPFLINTITLFIAMHHYEYRYIWNIELITLLFILIFFYSNQKDSS